MTVVYWIVGIFGALLGVAFYSLRSTPFLPVDLGQCSVSELDYPEHVECFFSTGYLEASQRFLATARKVDNMEILEMPVVEGLTTQVAILHRNPHKFLVHISGTHGVEGYAGSAVQLSYLRSLAAKTKNEGKGEGNGVVDLPTLVFVHALNPYGFHHNRRVNEDNVDLNRNFLNKSEFAFVKGRHPNYAHYEDLDFLLNPTKKPTGIIWLDELFSLFTLIHSVLTYDFHDIKRAMVSGNYHKQNGYGFGGFEQAVSTRNIIKLLREHLQTPDRAKEFVLIDVHTGLGPSGVDTLMFAHEDNLEKIFPTEFDPTGKPIGALKANSMAPVSASSEDVASQEAAKVSAGYDLTVGTSESLCKNFAAPRLSDKDTTRVCVTQEFGTVPTIVVGKHSLDENYAHFWGTAREKVYYKEQYRPCFYVESKSWKRSVVSRGCKLIEQVLLITFPAALSPIITLLSPIKHRL